MNQQYTDARPALSTLVTYKLICKTYMLLSLTLLFSALMAGVSIALNLPSMSRLILLVGFFGLLFLTRALRNSAWGLAAVFALSGFVGLASGPGLGAYHQSFSNLLTTWWLAAETAPVLGAYLQSFSNLLTTWWIATETEPVLDAYLQSCSNAGQLVMITFGGAGAIFLGLSGYALTSRKDFSFMGCLFAAGMLVAFVILLFCTALFRVPALAPPVSALALASLALALAVSAMFLLLAVSGHVLYETSEMIHGGETNYIVATRGLYFDIYFLLIGMSLLSTSCSLLLCVFAG